MQDDHFEWDDDKAARNWRGHRVTFEMAREAFSDDSRWSGRMTDRV